jgi:hypothetical protein
MSFESQRMSFESQPKPFKSRRKLLESQRKSFESQRMWLESRRVSFEELTLSSPPETPSLRAKPPWDSSESADGASRPSLYWTFETGRKWHKK